MSYVEFLAWHRLSFKRSVIRQNKARADEFNQANAKARKRH